MAVKPVTGIEYDGPILPVNLQAVMIVKYVFLLQQLYCILLKTCSNAETSVISITTQHLETCSLILLVFALTHHILT